MKLIDNLIDKYDDMINPIFLRELRQISNKKWAWFIGATLFCFMPTLFALAICDPNIMEVNNIGVVIFNFYYVVLSAIVLVIFPCYFFAKFISDKAKKIDEFIYITTVKPSVISMGRYYAPMSCAFISFAVSIPFIFLTAFMPGLNMWTVVLRMLVLWFAASALNAFCSGLISTDQKANVQHSSVDEFSKGVVCIGIIIYGIVFSVIFGGFTPQSENYITAAAGIGSIVLFVISYITLESAAVNTSYLSINVKLHFRKTLTVIWFIAVVLFLISSVDGSTMLASITFFTVLILLGSATEPEMVSDRVKLELPEKRTKRISMFPFCPGMLNGFCWCFIIEALTMMIAYIVSFDAYAWRYTFNVCLAVFLKVVFFLLIAVFTRRVFFKNTEESSNIFIGLGIYLALLMIYSLLDGMLGRNFLVFGLRSLLFYNTSLLKVLFCSTVAFLLNMRSFVDIYEYFWVGRENLKIE